MKEPEEGTRSPGAAVLNLGVAHQAACLSDVCITIHNSIDHTVMKQQWNNVMVGITTTRGTELKGRSVRKVEKHRPRARVSHDPETPQAPAGD